VLRTSGTAASRSHVEVDLALLRSATDLRPDDFDLDQPVSLIDLARAWPIDARTVGILRPILFVGFTVPESSEFVTVLALPQSEEVLAERIGVLGAQAMLTIVKVNPDWQSRPGRAKAPPRMPSVPDRGA
jgi:hypothetical protein